MTQFCHNPTVTTTYTLTAPNSAGQATSQVTVTVIPSQPVCIDFKNPPFALGTEYGSTVGQAPGDTAFTQNGVVVRVQEFLSGTFVGFGFARIDPAGALPTQNINTNNINLEFDFSSLGFTPRRVTFDFLDMGGVENTGVNGSALMEGELRSGTVEGIPVTITESAVPGGSRGMGELVGAVTQLTLGGQEFWIDNVCVQ